MLKLSYKVGNLQIKFINLLYNLNLDNNQFNELVSQKDANIANGIAQFQKFIKELSDKFNKPELKLCINYIQNRVDNNAEDFDFMFKSNQNDIERSYKLGIDQLYDDCNFVIENKKNVSKQIIDACNKIYKQMQNSQISFNDLNKQTNKLRQNKYGIQEQVQDQNKQKQESWKNLQNHKVFSSDNFTVYQVDTYEDMRNVAGDCASWCVARKDGRSHFDDYKPPYYLFSKGFHHPYILMHVNSHQFKNTGNIAFSADRPSSLEAIAIGKKFLIQKLHYTGAYKGDFEVFYNVNSNLKELYSEDVLYNLAFNQNISAQILKEIAEKTDDIDVLCNLVNNENTSAQILKEIAEKTDDIDVLYNLAFNQNISAQILKEIVEKTDDIDVLQNLVNNENTPVQILNDILSELKGEDLFHRVKNIKNKEYLKYLSKNSKNMYVLGGICANQNVDEQILINILKIKKNDELYKSCLENKNSTKKVAYIIGLNTGDSYLIKIIFRKYGFTESQIYEMIQKNNVCRFDILKNAYVLLSDATLSKIQKYFGKDIDMQWLLDQINKNRKIQKISHRIIKSYIINKIAKYITFKFK